MIGGSGRIHNLSGIVKSEIKCLVEYKQCFNPSRAGNVLYVRVSKTEGGMVVHKSDILLLDAATEETKVLLPSPSPHPTKNMYQGLEDLRLCSFKDRVWFTATCTHASKKQTNEMMLGRFSPTLESVDYLHPFTVAAAAATASATKNVVPFVCRQQSTLMLLDVMQLAIFEAQVEDMESPPTITKKNQLKIPKCYQADFPLKGSTSPVWLHGSTWGCVVHDVIDNRFPNRNGYLHRWMEFDLVAGTVTFLSRPFIVSHWGIEYVSGIHKPMDKDGAIVLYYGIQDRVAMKCETTLGQLRMGM
jgi:hypothetical protein